MMLEYLHLKYFRSHIDSRFDFSKGATAIIGLSMSGKTIVGRALEVLRNYRPPGFSYRYRYDDQPCVIEAGVDGHVVRLQKRTKALGREGNKAVYYLRYPTGE